jgi:hypothetical protein
MKHAIAILIAATILVGLGACAAIPPIPKYRINPGDRVGLLVEVGAKLVHTHAGSIFGVRTFVKRYPNDWGLDRYIAKALTSRLRGTGGFEVVDLRKKEVSYRDVEGLIAVKDKKWVIPAERQEMYNRLRNEFNLKAVVLVREVRAYTTSACTGAGYCIHYFSLGHGLFSQSSPLWFGFYSVAAYQTDIFLLGVPGNPGLGQDFRDVARDRTKRMRGFKDPKDIKNFPPKGWGPARGHIQAYIDQIAAKVASTLAKK